MNQNKTTLGLRRQCDKLHSNLVALARFTLEMYESKYKYLEV